ncbi:MAG: diaminopimelate epimerase [Lachnospiraceae bacterium]|nr:diaminopimelate epimerase [Lachnospiraceae bacterium]
MKFTKMEGLGNDYVYVNCLAEQVDNPSALAVRISDRHFGIGSDGLILIKPSETADFCMDMYNADGSRSEMCGNGIRCVGKYVYDYGLTDKTEVAIETLAGIKYLTLSVEAGKVREVTVDMGAPELNPARIPVASGKDRLVKEKVTVGNETYEMTCVSMGNPHAVVFVDSTETFPLETVGPLFEVHEMFPNRVNAEFVQVINRGEANMRVWERGTGETLACGTGACASAVACILNGLTEEEVTLHLLGGDLRIRWDREKDRVYMTGPATTVFEGEYACK